MTIRNRIKELRNVLASSLKPNPKNWRTHPQSQSQAMRGILDEIGYADSLIARELPDGSLMLIDGHLRAETTPDEMVPVQIVDLTEAEADKLLLSLDPLAAMAESNAAAMQQLCDDAETNNAALQAMWDEMQANVEQPPVEIVEDEIPEPPVDPITKAGDLWTLGDHRLLCGDSTKAEDVGRLMAGAEADSCVTDPPYGIGVDATMHKQSGTQYGKAASPKRHYAATDWDKLPPQSVIDNASSYATSVIFGGNYFALPPSRCWLVWDKENGDNAFADCELAWTNIDQPVRVKRHMWNGMIRKDKEERTIHPTQKPVAVMAWCVEMTSGLVYDPFLGSGTTLIAAEQLGRKCYGMEISPAYCDVIVKRWEALTGKKATLEITDGKTRPSKTADSSATTKGKSQQAKNKRTRAKA